MAWRNPGHRAVISKHNVFQNLVVDRHESTSALRVGWATMKSFIQLPAQALSEDPSSGLQAEGHGEKTSTEKQPKERLEKKRTDHWLPSKKRMKPER